MELVWTGCEHCRQEPCLVLQGWLPFPKKGAEPANTNSAKRKVVCRKIWQVLKHCGFWEQPEYKRLKTTAPGPEPLRDTALHSKREVMPKCVCARLRQLLPNEKGTPYKGHLWK
ncbi:hypothetical protein MRX96_056973 [Rhipicephalus microplus]